MREPFKPSESGIPAGAFARLAVDIANAPTPRQLAAVDRAVNAYPPSNDRNELLTMLRHRMRQLARRGAL